MQFSIVLVIKQNTHDGVDNFQRFLRIGMPTYARFLDLAAVKDFFIITPANELNTIKTLLLKDYPQDKWPWKFISEDKLIDTSISSGWGRQQTSKLAISMLVSTDHYLIVDDDTYLTRPFSYSNLFDTDGKLIWNRTLIDFPFFFLWSNQVLKFDFEVVQREKYHMAITPEIFVTAEVREIVRWLVATYGDSKQWQRYLADHKYTEYCLYWIWLIKHGRHTSLYSTLPLAQATSVYGHETTNDVQTMEENVKASFADNSKHYFSFVQSSIGHPLEAIEAAIKTHAAA